MKTKSWTLLFFAASSLALAGCGSNDNSNNGGGTTTTTTTTTTGTTGPYEQQILANGPQFYWLLSDSGNQFLDTMVSGNNLQVVGLDATLEQQGNSSPINNDGNLALVLDSGYVPSKIRQTSPTSFSIELWFQEAPSNSGGRIFGFGNAKTGNSSAGQYDRAIYIDDSGYVHFQINNGGVQDLSAGASVPTCGAPFSFGPCADDIWHHVVAAYDDSTGEMDLYVDNILTNTANLTANNISNYSGYWRLGDDNTSSPGTTFQFSGSIAQVAVYPVALTQAQVTADYTAAGH